MKYMENKENGEKTAKKNKKKRLVHFAGLIAFGAACLLTGLTIIIGTALSSRNECDLLPSLKNENIIMHAMGGIDGNDYTNSLEAFERHYARGRRVFEVDFALTNDNKVVAKHSKKINLSQQEFLSRKIMGKYQSV